jgi:hypothetical protein
MVTRGKTKSRSTRSKLTPASKRGLVRTAKSRSTAKTTSRRSLSLRGATTTKGSARTRTRTTALKKTTGSKLGIKRRSVKMTLEEAGRKGGLARAKKYNKAQLSAQAKQGARTIERARPGFHSMIGQRGGEARGRNR